MVGVMSKRFVVLCFNKLFAYGYLKKILRSPVHHGSNLLSKTQAC